MRTISRRAAVVEVAWREARRELEDRKIELLSLIFDTKKALERTYFRAPDGNVYQIQGPYQA